MKPVELFVHLFNGRCPPEKGIRAYDPLDLYPRCVDYPKKPWFTTPIYGIPSPYVKRASICPDGPPGDVARKSCRRPHWKRYIPECPETERRVGPNMNLFLICD